MEWGQVCLVYNEETQNFVYWGRNAVLQLTHGNLTQRLQ